MKLSKRNIFLFLWAFSPCVDFLASNSVYPNQIINLYNLLVLFIGFIFLPISSNFLFKLSKWLLLPVLYVSFFIIVSYFSLNFENSIKYNVLYLPLILVNFINWFLVGFYFHENKSLKYFYILIVIYSITTILFSFFGFSQDLSRIFTGLEIPLGLIAAIFVSDVIVVYLLTFFAFISLQKTVILSSVIGYLLSKKTFKFQKKPLNFKINISKFKRYLVLLIILPPFLFFFLSYIISSFSRFFEGDDLIRLQIFSYSYELLINNFPHGIGYQNFIILSSDIIPYTTFTTTGDQLDGVALHNSFFHFALEGGLIIVLIMLLLYYKFFDIAFRLKKRITNSNIGSLLIVFMVVCSFYGLIHQFHGSRYFFGIFAFCFSIYERYNSKIKNKFSS